MALKVMTLNLWHDAGPYAARAALVRDWIDRLEPDLIGFQEALRLPGFDQAAELLAGAGYHLGYVRASAFWKAGEEDRVGDVGNAVASRFPIRDRAELLLPGSGDGETRAALSVTVEAPVGPVCFTVTHLNWKLHHGEVRERQVVALCDWVRERAPRRGYPPILVGDFNAPPDAAEIRFVKGWQSLAGESVCFLDAWEVAGGAADGDPGLTWDNRNPYAAAEVEPNRRIDYVFVGLPRRTAGLGQLLACRVVCDREKGGVWPSDHFGVYAELRTEPLPEPAWREGGGGGAGGGA